jgi:arginine decarboxylase
VADAFLERLTTSLARYTPGDPMNENTLLGPLISFAAHERYECLVSARVGGWIVPGGILEKIHPEMHGYYVLPAVVLAHDPLALDESLLAKAETFAPILVVEIFDEEDEAIRRHEAWKFGLTASELIKGLELLASRGMEDCLQLLHFHQGSQITNIRHIKGALNEASRIYTELVKRGAGLRYLDVGGGLGVDYDGSQTNFESSVNYSLQEYANDVVSHVQNACDEAGVPHPTIISESGRAVVAYHSMLIFGVLGVSEQGGSSEVTEPAADAEQPLHDLWEAYQGINVRNLLESYHDAQQSLDTAMNLFSSGYLPLDQRSAVENLYWAICRRIHKLTKTLEFVPEELEGLQASLSDTYFCNFSLFQSIPDSWAIKQLFPVMPIHRLNERPSQAAVLGDVTCDSDGKIDQFIDRRDVKRTLPLHTWQNEPYYLGAFLIGAYQEILGDLHNLFGDTNAVHVSMDERGEVVVDAVIKGDTVREVLDYVEFDSNQLVQRLRDSIEQAVREGRICDSQAGRFLKFYEEGLGGYTYLEEPG